MISKCLKWQFTESEGFLIIMPMNRIELLIKYLEKSPQDSFLLHALALEYMKINKTKEAIDLWTELLSHNPDYVGSYYHLGKAWETLGEEEKAKQVYESGMAMAKRLNENKAYQELQQALDELL